MNFNSNPRNELSVEEFDQLTSKLKIGLLRLTMPGWNGIIYFAGMIYVGQTILHSFVIATVVFVSTVLNYNRLLLFRFGFVLLCVCIALDIATSPEGNQWAASLNQIVAFCHSATQ